MADQIVQVDFKKRQSYKHQEQGVYLDPRTGSFYERPYVDGRQTWRKLNATTLRLAIIEKGKNRAEQYMAKKGLAKDPYTSPDVWTIKKLADYYVSSGCPKKSRSAGPRTANTLKQEIKHVETLMGFFGRKLPNNITLEDCRDYHAWRIQRLKRRKDDPELSWGKGGDRQVDKELVTLSNIFRWAIRNARSTGITANPIGHDREKFRDANQVRHSRDLMPSSGDELHSIARYFFNSESRSHVLGWQVLLTAMIGQRVNEIVRLRWDAKNEFEPGFIHKNCLFLYRSKTSKGTYSYATIFPELRKLLDALKAWRDEHYPESPWFLPSPENPQKHINITSLTHGLRRIKGAMGLPDRTAHGLRSFYVNVLRSRGMSDAEIALRIGHRTGGRLIVEVYGDILPYKLSWMPSGKTEPAWAIMVKGQAANPPQREILLEPLTV